MSRQSPFVRPFRPERKKNRTCMYDHWAQIRWYDYDCGRPSGDT